MTRDNGPRPDPTAWVDNRQRVEARYAIGDGVAAVGAVISYCDAPTVTIETDDGRRVSWRVDLTVAVYDLSADLIGTVRGMGNTLQPWAKRNHNEWVCITHDETTDDREMAGCPVTGAVPGTPAAEAQTPLSVELQLPPVHVDNEAIVQGQYYGKHDREPRPSVRVVNEPHGLPVEVRRNVADLLAAGNRTGAIDTVHQYGGLEWPDARSYVEGMSEYQSYLSEHGEEKRRAFEGPSEKWLWYEVAPGHCITAATRQHAEDAWVGQYSQDRSYGTTVDELLIDGYTEVSA